MADWYDAEGNYIGSDGGYSKTVLSDMRSAGALDTNKAPQTKTKGRKTESKPPSNTYKTISGEPTIPLEATGDIKYSRIAVSNNNKVHICDTTLYIRRQVNLGKIAEVVIQGIRDAIKAIKEFFGITPGTNGFIEQLKDLAEYIKDKVEWLKEIQTAIDTFIIVVREIKAVIEYILNLPERLIAYFTGCLKEAYAELAKQFADVVQQGSDALSDDTANSFISATKDVLKETQSLITTATATVVQATTAIPVALTSTNTAEEAAKAQEILGGNARAEINQYITDSFSEYTPQTDFKTP